MWEWESKSGEQLDNDGEIGAPTGPIGGDLYYRSDARYQLALNGGFVTLQNSSGTTFSDDSSTSFDAVYARENGEGFEVLLDGTGSREGQAFVWQTDFNGVIQSGSGWFRGTDDFWGWEVDSNEDLDNDGVVGNPNSNRNGELWIDGQDRYRLYAPESGSYLLLRNSKGVTYSDGSSGAWDAVSAIDQGDGTFRVLLDGAGSRENQAYVWTTNDQGVITSGNGGWKSGEALQALSLIHI